MSPADATQAAKLVDAVREIEEFLGADHGVVTGKPPVQFVAGFRNYPTHQIAFNLPVETARPLLHLLATTLRVQLEDLGVS